MAEPRPKITSEIIAQAAKELCDKNKWSEEEAQDIAKTYFHYMGGYELAKRLDDECGWQPDTLMVEDLDAMSSRVDAIHHAACLQWAKDNDIQPPFPVGSITDRGEITGISTYRAASYLIREPGVTKGTRLIVPFEDVRLV